MTRGTDLNHLGAYSPGMRPCGHILAPSSFKRREISVRRTSPAYKEQKDIGFGVRDFAVSEANSFSGFVIQPLTLL